MQTGFLHLDDPEDLSCLTGNQREGFHGLERKEPIHNIYHLGTDQLLRFDTEKDLGVKLHHTLAWHNHILQK